jgi:hypothetical protein
MSANGFFERRRNVARQGRCPIMCMDKLKFIEEPVRTSSTAPATTTRETTTGTSTAPADTTTTTKTTKARTANANDWTPDHAVMSGNKEQLKALPQFKCSDYN